MKALCTLSELNTLTKVSTHFYSSQTLRMHILYWHFWKLLVTPCVFPGPILFFVLVSFFPLFASMMHHIQNLPSRDCVLGSEGDTKWRRLHFSKAEPSGMSVIKAKIPTHQLETKGFCFQWFFFLHLPLTLLKLIRTDPVLIPFCWKHGLQAELSSIERWNCWIYWSIIYAKHAGSHKIWQQIFSLLPKFLSQL